MRFFIVTERAITEAVCFTKIKMLLRNVYMRCSALDTIAKINVSRAHIVVLTQLCSHC